MIIDARRGGPDDAAETQHDALLVGVHDVDPRHQPECKRDQSDDYGAAAAKAARQSAPESSLALLQKLFEIERLLAAPRTAIAAAPALPFFGASFAVLIVPGHKLPVLAAFNSSLTTSERLSGLALYAAAVLCFPVISRSFDSVSAGRALEAVTNAMTPCSLSFSAFLITSTL